MVLLVVLRKKEKEEKEDKMKKTITAALLVVVGGIFSASTIAIIQQSAQAFIDPGSDLREPKAPMAASEEDGNNVYVVWWTNRSGNWEVMFRASTDSGSTFGDKINLSNSPDTQSQTAEILAVGNNMVFVSWWELNENVHPHTNESVLRVSTDAGETFGPVINLGTNGTITTTTNTTATTAAPE
ncbi:MAG: hypothetical protein M3275_08620 [Thermoproteota archaeon]|nr:hypothetical protein [Thermoproteota archaeon]